jgi:hypothetical protein
MPRLSASEGYAIAAVVALFLVAALNTPALTLGVAIVGLTVGLFLLRRQPLTRAGVMAVIGFTVAGALAGFTLLR